MRPASECRIKKLTQQFVWNDTTNRKQIWIEWLNYLLQTKFNECVFCTETLHSFISSRRATRILLTTAQTSPHLPQPELREVYGIVCMFSTGERRTLFAHWGLKRYICGAVRVFKPWHSCTLLMDWVVVDAFRYIQFIQLVRHVVILFFCLINTNIMCEYAVIVE